MKIERDILGKATAYFAKGAKCSKPLSNLIAACGRSPCNVGYFKPAWAAITHMPPVKPAPHRHLSAVAMGIWRELRNQGVAGKQRLQTLMQMHGIAPRARNGSR